MAFADGGTFAGVAARDPYRRDLVLSVANSCGGNTHTLEYSYDALLRPISRNTDTFGYNARSEVCSANIGGNSETHEYDFIGNPLLAAFNSVTNTYTANCLNQYTSILCASATPREISHDADVTGGGARKRHFPLEKKNGYGIFMGVFLFKHEKEYGDGPKNGGIRGDGACIRDGVFRGR